MIKVKALEFVQLGDWVYSAAVGMRDFYTVYFDPVTSQWYWEHSGIRVDSKRYPTKAEAISHAQAHHTQHVMSMIEIDTPTNQGKQP